MSTTLPSLGYVVNRSLVTLGLTVPDPIRRRGIAYADHRYVAIHVGAAGTTGGYEAVPRGTGDQGIDTCNRHVPYTSRAFTY